MCCQKIHPRAHKDILDFGMEAALARMTDYCCLCQISISDLLLLFLANSVFTDSDHMPGKLPSFCF